MRNRLVFGTALGSALLGACGGGGGGGGSPTGQFVDSLVSGLDYNTSGGSLGTTDADGRFSYGSGQSLTFFVGDIVLGVAPGAAILTPVDLIAGATDETNEEVINIARFLQTIDLDQDPDNGIEISDTVRQAAVGQTIDFTTDAVTFETLAQPTVDAITAGLPGGSRALVSIAEARDHLGDSLRSPGRRALRRTLRRR